MQLQITCPSFFLFFFAYHPHLSYSVVIKISTDLLQTYDWQLWKINLFPSADQVSLCLQRRLRRHKVSTPSLWQTATSRGPSFAHAASHWHDSTRTRHVARLTRRHHISLTFSQSHAMLTNRSHRSFSPACNLQICKISKL